MVPAGRVVVGLDVIYSEVSNSLYLSSVVVPQEEEVKKVLDAVKQNVGLDFFFCKTVKTSERGIEEKRKLYGDLINFLARTADGGSVALVATEEVKLDFQSFMLSFSPEEEPRSVENNFFEKKCVFVQVEECVRALQIRSRDRPVREALEKAAAHDGPAGYFQNFIARKLLESNETARYSATELARTCFESSYDIHEMDDSARKCTAVRALEVGMLWEHGLRALAANSEQIRSILESFDGNRRLQPSAESIGEEVGMRRMPTTGGPSVDGVTSEHERLTAGSVDDDSSAYECNICFQEAVDPVVTVCGHLFCWPCLSQWLNSGRSFKECPVCKAGVEEDKVIPIYGRGGSRSDPRTRQDERTATSESGASGGNSSHSTDEVPRRPAGQRPPPVPNTSRFGFQGNAGGFTIHASFGLFPSLFGLAFVRCCCLVQEGIALIHLAESTWPGRASSESFK
mmetsp:Transcript_31743/g.82826  ORF Transcript_31743/g.82826 Transcript_31743/m.82826 type:complete len:456 (-) Transcript_31743:361-1728(-)